MQQRQSGVAVIVVLLFTVVVLMAIIVGSLQLTLGNRKSMANEAAAFQAVLASESGQNAFVARSLDVAVFNAPARCKSDCEAFYRGKLNAWLGSAVGTSTDKVGDFAVGNDSRSSLELMRVTVSAVPDTVPTEYSLTGVEVRSAGTAANSTARVVQQYSAVKQNLKFPSVPGAITSHPSVDLQGGVEIVGATLTSSGNDGIYQNMMRVTRTSEQAPSLSQPITVDVPSNMKARAQQLPEGAYVRLPVGAGTGTFRVDANDGDRLTLQPVSFPAGLGALIPPLSSGQLGVDYVMNGVVSTVGNTMTVNAMETFVAGDSLRVTVGGVAYTANITGTSLSGTQQTLNLSWTPSAPPTGVPEGTSVTKTTNAVVTAGSFSDTNNKNSTITGNVISGATGLVPSPMDNVLFKKTFGQTPAEMKAMSTVETDGGFNGPLSGMHWIMPSNGIPGGDVNLNNEKLTGQGIMIVDGSLTINQNSATACAFSGILYVRGNVRIQGGLELCGALVVEGSILSSTGAVIGTDNEDAFFSGNGRKVIYSADALIDAVGSAGPYDFTVQPGTWRQQ